MDKKLTQLESYQQQVIYKFKEFKSLSDILQFRLSNICKHNQKGNNNCKQQFQKLNTLYNQFCTKMHNFANKFSTFIENLELFKQNYLTNKKIISKLNDQLLNQSNINKSMKLQVLELNSLINDHVESTKNKLYQKDQIIKYLNQKFQHHNKNQRLDKSESYQKNQQNNNKKQAIIQDKNSKSILQTSFNTNSHKSQLEIIREQQQHSISGQNSSFREEKNCNTNQTCEISKLQQSVKSFNNHNTEIQNTLKESTILNEKKIDLKTKTRFFIQHFRQNKYQPNKQEQKITKKCLQEEGLFKSGKSSELSVEKCDTNSKINFPKNQSPKKSKFSIQGEFEQKVLRQIKNPNSNQLKTKIFQIKSYRQPINSEQKINSKQKSNSKQKIHLVQRQNKKQSIFNKKKSKQKFFEGESKLIFPRPSSRQKLSLTCKNSSQNTHKLKQFLGNKTINNRKNICLAIQKFIKQNLESIQYYIGDKAQQKIYKGNKNKNIRSGKGRLQYLNGLIYEGEFKDDVRHGNGILSLDKNLIYEGQWQRDKLCGKGLLKNIYLINKTENLNIEIGNFCYSGFFSENRFHGQGIIYFPSLEKFYCKFHDGIPYGEYTYYNKQGSVQFGIWDPAII